MYHSLLPLIRFLKPLHTLSPSHKDSAVDRSRQEVSPQNNRASRLREGRLIQPDERRLVAMGEELHARPATDLNRHRLTFVAPLLKKLTHCSSPDLHRHM